MRIFKAGIILFFVILVGQLLSADFAFASSTDGTIDLIYKYAWGENIGWINFGTTNSNVQVTDSELSGYALGENIGWINLGNVANNGEGYLSGYAWSENTGWINFAPTNGGVIINSSGEFIGSALGENIGWIIFDCSTSACVKTDWRPQSARVCTSWIYSDWSSCANGQQTRTVVSSSPSGCSEGSPTLSQSCSSGGGLPPGAYNPPAQPSLSPTNSQGGFRIIINNNDGYTDNRKAVLSLFSGSDTARMAIADNSALSGGTGQIALSPTYSWDLCQGRTDCPEGNYTVYAKFFTQYGMASDLVSASIVLRAPTPLEKIKEIPAKIIEEARKIPEKIAAIPEIIKKIPEIIQNIPEILKPKPPEETKPPELPPVEEVVPKETPLTFQGQWQLLPTKPIGEFVLAPLPSEIIMLAEKFPELGRTLEKVGVTKITDIEKLQTIKLTLPGLTESVGLPTAEIQPGKFALPQGVPVAKLSAGNKQQIPSEIVFAKTGGELIDFNIALSINDKGEPEQRISTISGKPLQLVVKPDNPVKDIKGYVVFKSKQISQINANLDTNSTNISEISGSFVNIRELAASALFALPVFAQPVQESQNIPIEGSNVSASGSQVSPLRGISQGETSSNIQETRLVLQEFEYTDPDGDGIYTAEIQAPVVEGEYEIITVMDYEEPALAMKEIRLITVVDPEGYIYAQLPEGKLRITGAIISLFWLNPETKQYELWPAKEYQQENPQITDDTGKYSFLVPPGMYYLKVETPNYPAYQSDTFSVKEGSGIHMDIELKTKYDWLKVVDWKILVVIIFGILLLYNFYKDRIREKFIKKA